MTSLSDEDPAAASDPDELHHHGRHRAPYEPPELHHPDEFHHHGRHRAPDEPGVHTVDPDLPPEPAPLIPLLAVVAVGGALGSLARYGIDVALPYGRTDLPLATLLVNVVGCVLLGILVAGWEHARWMRPFLGTGVLGGFTTFSTFALETDRLLDRAPAVALLYVALSLLLGLFAAALGLRLGTRGR